MADLKIKIQEELTLNGVDQGGTHIKTISGINAFSKRIVNIAAGDDATILVFRSTNAIADGALDLQNVKYIRITNLDSTNSVNLSLQIFTENQDQEDGASETCTILLEAGMTFMMGAPDEGIAVDDDGATIITELTDLESIIIDPGTDNTGSVEVFTASI
tara:strand:- start:125 stop:604 length:480 start_codon:yes stop_codon:yes gene_type:complete